MPLASASAKYLRNIVARLRVVQCQTETRVILILATLNLNSDGALGLHSDWPTTNVLVLIVDVNAFFRLPPVH